LRILNAPVPGDGGGVPFDDLMPHFVIGGDEACLMASATGVVKVIGDKLKKKHKIIVNNSRVSMTILRTAATGGATGPTHFSMEASSLSKATLPPGSSATARPRARPSS
jgi:hypothetical protein